MPLFLVFLTAFVFTVILVPLVGQFARARGMYAQPSYDRWHRRPVPKVGGIAMMAPLLFVAAVSGVVTELFPVLLGMFPCPNRSRREWNRCSSWGPWLVASATWYREEWRQVYEVSTAGSS